MVNGTGSPPKQPTIKRPIMEVTRTQQEVNKLTSVLLVVSIVCCILIAGAPFVGEGIPGICQTSSCKNRSTGWFSVVGASLIFGTTCIPMKSPELAAHQIDPMVFAFYVGGGIFLISAPLVVYLLSAGIFKLTYWGLLGASNIFIINFFAFNAVEALGMAVAPGCWSGIGMITAFLVGTVVFKESVHQWGKATVAVVLLAGGVYCISTSKSAENSNDNKSRDNSIKGENNSSVGSRSSNSKSDNTNTNVNTNDDGSSNIKYVGLSTKDSDIIADLSGIIESPMTLAENVVAAADAAIGTDVDYSAAFVSGIEVVTFHTTAAATESEHDVEEAASVLLLSPQTTHINTTESSEQIPKLSRNSNQTNSSSNSGNSFSSNNGVRSLFQGPYVIGFLCCLATGLCDGSMMVPFKLSQRHHRNSSDYINNANAGGNASSSSSSSLSSLSSSDSDSAALLASLNYIASFGVLAVLASPALLLLYIATLRRGSFPSRVEFSVAGRPGVASGMLWACANLLSVIGTHYLGMSISFPLTQTCVIFASAWGVGYFKEDIAMKRRFATGMVAVLIGSYFLGTQA